MTSTLSLKSHLPEPAYHQVTQNERVRGPVHLPNKIDWNEWQNLEWVDWVQKAGMRSIRKNEHGRQQDSAVCPYCRFSFSMYTFWSSFWTIVLFCTFPNAFNCRHESSSLHPVCFPAGRSRRPHNVMPQCSMFLKHIKEPSYRPRHWLPRRLFSVVNRQQNSRAGLILHRSVHKCA